MTTNTREQKKIKKHNWKKRLQEEVRDLICEVADVTSYNKSYLLDELVYALSYKFIGWDDDKK